MRLLPRVDNLAYEEKQRRLEAEVREGRGLAPDIPLWEALEMREYLTLLHRALVGPVITAWGAFDDEDGNEIPWRLDGQLTPDENIGNAILHMPGVGNDYLEAIEPIDEAHKRTKKVMEKNSLEPSVGISATEGNSKATEQE